MLHPLVRYLPRRFLPFALMSRWDRPVGVWLMLLPALWGLTLGAQMQGGQPSLFYLVLFLVGGWVMRGAGCTINDILDRQMDRQVARTAARPLTAQTISVAAAWFWLALQLLIGLIILVQLPRLAIIAGFAALPPILLYPLMKRLTWWPQAWLGLTFNWGFWIGVCIYTLPLHPAFYLFYSGALCWTLGYDTIYAVQDRADDALVGVKSTARLFGAYTKIFVYSCYALALLLWLGGGLLFGLGGAYLAGWLVTLGVTVWILRQWREDDALSCRRAFICNQWVGLALWLTILLAGS